MLIWFQSRWLVEAGGICCIRRFWVCIFVFGIEKSWDLHPSYVVLRFPDLEIGRAAQTPVATDRINKLSHDSRLGIDRKQTFA